MEDFVYHALEDQSLVFRLLVLHPLGDASVPGSPLHGGIAHVTLEDENKPVYETVSYCWGDPARSKLIVVDGQALWVPANTERTLRKLAFTDRPRFLWIDAVCINQDDLAERSRQVAIMSTIYESSIGNVIDLGDADSMDGRAIDNIDAVFEEVCEETGTNNLKDVANIIIQNGRRVTPEGNLRTPVDEDALVQFFSRPWFRRAWVVQEALRAPQNECLCGRTNVNFARVLTAAAWLTEFRSYNLPESLRSLLGLENASIMRECTFHSQTGTMGLTMALQHFSHLEATDPRDKVFGTLGTIHAGYRTPHLLRPDYTKSVAAVFRDATRCAIQLPRELVILRYISHREDDDIGRDGFPSWVPRFDRGIDCRKDPTALAQSRSIRGHAIPRERHLGEVNGDPHALVLRGVIVDTIDTVYPIFAEENTRLFWEEMKQLFNEDAEFKIAFARTLTADTNYRKERMRDEDLQAFDAWFDHLQRARFPTLGELPSDDDQTLRQVAQFQKAMIDATSRRRFAYSKSDLTALVPKVSRPGDIFVSVAAGLTPYVLRPEKNSYRIMGECYLEDNMEALKGYEGNPDAYTVFNII